MKYNAVCVSCGEYKKSALARCKSCGFQPKTDYEAARSLILSETHVIHEIAIGRSAEQLQQISQSIRSGRPYPIDGEEQKQVVREYNQYLKLHPPSSWPPTRKVKWLLIISLLFVCVAFVLVYLILK